MLNWDAAIWLPATVTFWNCFLTTKWELRILISLTLSLGNFVMNELPSLTLASRERIFNELVTTSFTPGSCPL